MSKRERESERAERTESKIERHVDKEWGRVRSKSLNISPTFYLFIYLFTLLPLIFTPGLKTQRPWGSSQQLLFAYFSNLSVLLVHLPKTDTETHTCSHIHIRTYTFVACLCQWYFGGCCNCCWHEIAVNIVVCVNVWCHVHIRPVMRTHTYTLKLPHASVCWAKPNVEFLKYTIYQINYNE